MLARHRSTGKEYAIKVLDKGHLKRNNKLATALAEKNTLVRLGAGHPGIVHLHWTFQDEWSLCESPRSRSHDTMIFMRLKSSYWIWPGTGKYSRGYLGLDPSHWHVVDITLLS